MAKVYLEKLSCLISDLDLSNSVSAKLETKHFFSGAALYADQVICASWSPAGLAFKLPAPEVEKLLASGKAKPLKYFEKGRVKKGYAVFDNPDTSKKARWKNYFLRAIDQST